MAVDAVHDLLLHVLGDTDAAAAATADVTARAASRVREGLLDDLDETTLLTCAHDHLVARAAVDDDLEAEAVTDLTVLHLVARRGLDPREVARVTGVRRRSVVTRRTRAARALAAAEGTSAAAATRTLAEGHPTAAPAEVHRRLALLLTDLTAPPRRRGGRLRIVVLTLLTIVGLAVATPLLVRPATFDPAVSVGESVEYTPTPSTVVVEGATEPAASEDPALVTDDDGSAATPSSDGSSG